MRISYRGRWTDFIRHLWQSIEDDQVFNGAAAMAYFLLLAVFPAAILVLSMVPYLHIPHLQQALMDLLQQVLPPEAAALLDQTLMQVLSKKAGGLLTFGAVFTIWSASTGMYAVMQQLNMAYEVKERRPFWKVQGTAILLTAIFIGLVIGSFSLVIFGGVVQSWVASLLGWSHPLRIFFATLRWIIIAAALLLGIALIYRFGPDVNSKFRYFSPGGIAGAVLAAIASIGFRIYVFFFGSYNATYGSLGATIILMLWLYLVGIALLVGGEINSILQPSNSGRPN